MSYHSQELEVDGPLSRQLVEPAVYELRCHRTIADGAANARGGA
jgi:hypothetical protein